MEPKDYFEKYKECEFTMDVVKNYINDLNVELEQQVLLSETRTPGTYARTVREINAKHNEVMKLFKAVGRQEPLMEDAFAIYWRMMSPELKMLVQV